MYTVHLYNEYYVAESSIRSKTLVESLVHAVYCSTYRYFICTCTCSMYMYMYIIIYMYVHVHMYSTVCVVKSYRIKTLVGDVESLSDNIHCTCNTVMCIHH